MKPSRSIAVALLVALSGCGGTNHPADSGDGHPDAAARDATLSDAPAPDAPPDIVSPRDAPLDTLADALPDAPLDAPTDAPLDALPDAPADSACTPFAPPSYTCTAGGGGCPGGVCISSWCLGPSRDPNRWAACGDGVCAPCEGLAPGCEVDCGGPARTGAPVYDPSHTLTLKLHGLVVSTSGSIDDRTYGDVLADTGMELALRRYAPTLPAGLTDPTAPNQLVALEYYGTHPASWLSPAEVARIEALDPHGPQALARYATIVAIFLRHRLADAGATGANILCHSMGCHIARYLIEHDLEQLASSGRIARVVSVAGALNGAGLAELFDNPMLQSYAALVPIQTSDFVHLNPDFVTDESAIWDHHLYEANNPNWAGILLHEESGTNPVTAGFVRPLDITNPTDEPNDSVLYGRDTYFVAQDAAARFVAADGSRPLPSHTWHHATHTEMESHLGANALGAAALFHHRRVTVTLRSTTLYDDHELPGPPGTFGTPPADLVPETHVTYSPYLDTTFGVTGAEVQAQTLDDRSAPMFNMNEGDTLDAGVVLFDAPVFDGQPSLHLTFDLREVDHYPHYGVNELPAGSGSVLASFDGDVAIADGEFHVDTADVHCTLEVRVLTLY